MKTKADPENKKIINDRAFTIKMLIIFLPIAAILKIYFLF